jgi:hypothetical protein
VVTLACETESLLSSLKPIESDVAKITHTVIDGTLNKNAHFYDGNRRVNLSREDRTADERESIIRSLFEQVTSGTTPCLPIS